MAVLDATTRALINAAIQRYFSDNSLSCALIKTELQAAVDATDSWIDTNAASYNTALPVAARSNLTAQEKTLLFCWVAMKRAGLTLPREV